MVQAIFYTIPYSLLNEKTTADEINECGLNILIDDLQFTIADIVNYAKTAKTEFLFSLSGPLVKHPNFETLFEKLYSLFTVSAFAGSAAINLPVLDIELVKENNDGLAKLKSYFKGQGENLNIIESGLSTNILNKILFLDAYELKTFSEVQFAAYHKLDIEQVVFLPRRIVDANRGAILQDIFPATNKAADLLFNKVTLARQLANSHHQTSLWQNRAQLYLSFLTLSKEIGEGEYYSIKQWYHTEYEVLPLWYKQFGHIIKVLSGKRSFKSLFDKN